MHTYKKLLASVFISIFGTQMSNFALGIWVFESTQSTFIFALVGFAAMAPPLLFAPLLGSFVDRFNHRHLIFIGHTGGAICLSLILLLYWQDTLSPWRVISLATISSLFNGLLTATLNATCTQLINKHQLTQAQAMTQGCLATSQIIAPGLAAFVYASFGLSTALAIDLCSFLIAILLLSLVRFGRRKTDVDTHPVASGLLRNVLLACDYLKKKPGLIALMLLVAISNLCMGMVIVLFTPLILSISTVENLGIATTTAGLGMLLGNLAMLRWNKIHHNIRNIYIFCALSGLTLWCSVINLSFSLQLGGAFTAMFCRAIILTSSQSIWLRKVHPSIQGRVFGLSAFIAKSAFPVGYLIAGPLVQHLCQPLLNSTNEIAELFLWLIGNGPARDIALLFFLLGTLLIVSSALAYAYPKLRKIEMTINDYQPDNIALPITGQNR